MSSILKNAVSAAVLAASTLSASVAMGADLYGGGATFPAVPYVGTGFQSANTRIASSVSPPPANAAPLSTGSIFAAYVAASGHNLTYCQTGSGTGKNVLTTLTPPANGACGLFSGTPAGFSAPQAQPTYPNYIGTDSPLSLTDYNNFNNNFGGAHTALVQIPSIVGSVALPMNLPNNTRLNLSIAQVCSIFTGAAQRWNQVDSSLPDTMITVVYRSDGSGTSFAFTNFLARNCNPSSGTPVFLTNQTYSSAVSVSRYASSSAQSGNLNVVRTVSTTPGAIGYADPGDVQGLGVDYPNVAGANPLALASPSIGAASLLTGRVLGAADPTTGLPTTAAAPTTVTNALVLVDPATVFSGTYPILAPTYLAFYNTGNGTEQATALRGLMTFIHTASSGRPTLPAGFAYIGGTSLATINRAITFINP
jgi:ABC-type phosphate transport system substrate-binding protein